MDLLNKVRRFFNRQSDDFPNEVWENPEVRPAFERIMAETFVSFPISMVMSLATRNSDFNRFLNSVYADTFWKAKINHDHSEIWTYIAESGILKPIVRNRAPDGTNPWRHAYFEPHRLGSRIAKLPKNRTVVMLHTSAEPMQYPPLSHASALPPNATYYIGLNGPGAYALTYAIATTGFELVETATERIRFVSLPAWNNGRTIAEVRLGLDYVFVEVKKRQSLINHGLVYSLITYEWIEPTTKTLTKSVGGLPTGERIRYQAFRDRRQSNLIECVTTHGHDIMRGVLNVAAYAAALRTSQTQEEVRAKCLTFNANPAETDFNLLNMEMASFDALYNWMYGGPKRTYVRQNDGMTLTTNLVAFSGPFLSDRPPYNVNFDETGNLVLQEFPNKKHDILANTVLANRPKGKLRYIDNYGDTLLWELSEGNMYIPSRPANEGPSLFEPAILMLSSRRDTACFELPRELFEQTAQVLNQRHPDEDSEDAWFLKARVLGHDATHIYVDVYESMDWDGVVFKINIDAIMQANNIAKAVTPVTIKQECIACGMLSEHSCGECKLPYCSKRCQELDWETHTGYCKKK